jgi:hypothetical protein
MTIASQKTLMIELSRSDCSGQPFRTIFPAKLIRAKLRPDTSGPPDSQGGCPYMISYGTA